MSATKFFSVVASVASPLTMRACAMAKISRWTGSWKWSGLIRSSTRSSTSLEDRIAPSKLLFGLDVVRAGRASSVAGRRLCRYRDMLVHVLWSPDLLSPASASVAAVAAGIALRSAAGVNHGNL